MCVDYIKRELVRTYHFTRCSLKAHIPHRMDQTVGNLIVQLIHLHIVQYVAAVVKCYRQHLLSHVMSAGLLCAYFALTPYAG